VHPLIGEIAQERLPVQVRVFLVRSLRLFGHSGVPAAICAQFKREQAGIKQGMQIAAQQQEIIKNVGTAIAQLPDVAGFKDGR